MKLFTLILAATLISSVSSAQITNINYTDKASIKFNLLSIANGVVKVKMYNQAAGTYTVSILDENGNIAATKVINHMTDATMEIADFGKSFIGGTYQVQVVSPVNEITNETFLLLM